MNMKRITEKLQELSSECKQHTAMYAKVERTHTAIYAKLQHTQRELDELEERAHASVVFLHGMFVHQMSIIEELNKKVDEMQDWIQMMDDKEEAKERRWRQQPKQQAIIDQ